MKYQNCIVGQSGGPTTAINSSLCGVIEGAMASDKIKKVYGAINGIEGILNNNIIDFGKEDPKEIKLLRQTPSAALGSCRYKLKKWQEDTGEYEKVFEFFRKNEIGYFFYIGGNDSMDTVDKLSSYAKEKGYNTRIMGIPKTIDNDLVATDHTPGYGSAAKYIAASVMEIARDAAVYDKEIINVVEVMGRHAGWLAAASALAKTDTVIGAPDLIYFPEVPFSMEKVLNEIAEAYKENKRMTIVISEGLKDEDGNYLQDKIATDSVTDAFGHKQMGGLGSYIGEKIQNQICPRVKVIEFNVLQRAAAHFASKTDIDEAYQCGWDAVKYAVQGETGKMIGMKRISNQPYKMETLPVPVGQVANAEKVVPIEWINENKNGLTKEGLDYIRPLIEGEVSLVTEGGLPRFARLAKKR